MESKKLESNQYAIDQSYLDLLNKFRDYLLIIINVTVGILSLFIYPLDRFENTEARLADWKASSRMSANTIANMTETIAK